MGMVPRATEAPQVGGLPLIGSGLDLLRDPYRWWPRQYREHGPVFRVTLPIEGRTWIAMVGREANELLAREGQRVFSQKMTYPRAPEVLRTPNHPSITEGSLQRHLKRQIAPGFSRQAAAAHLPAISTWLRQYVDGWRVGQTFNVAEETSRMGLNAISMFATGEPLGHDTEPFRHYATVFTGVIAMSWPMAVMKLPRVRRAREGLDELIEERLAAHRHHPANVLRAPDYFDFILQGTMPDGRPLPDRVVVVFGQIPFKNMGVYAGRIINQVLYQLVSRPEVLERVQPEIDQLLADDEITLDEITKMPLTRAAILETLRVLPIAVTLQRTVCEPFDFGGYRFEVGDRVFTAISATHFLEEYFPEPERFDIDRFLPGRSEDRQPAVFNPFGLGHHGCVAAGLFEVLTIAVVSTVLHRWRLQADYRLRTIVDALPGPWPGHRMRVVERRLVAPRPGKRRRSPTRQVSLSAELLDLVDRSPHLRLAPGEILFSEGGEADRIYFVRSGRLRVEKRRRDGTTVVLAQAEPGSVVGEIAILRGVTRTASVVAATSASVIAVDGETFRRAVEEADITAKELGELALRRHAVATLASVLSADELPALRGKLQEREAAPGEVVLRQGDEPDAFFLLVDGEVDVTIERADSAPVELGQLHAPDCFGEIAMLEKRPRVATVAVAPGRPARLIALDRKAFAELARDEQTRQALDVIANERLAGALELA